MKRLWVLVVSLFFAVPALSTSAAVQDWTAPSTYDVASYPVNQPVYFNPGQPSSGYRYQEIYPGTAPETAPPGSMPAPFAAQPNGAYQNQQGSNGQRYYYSGGMNDGYVSEGTGEYTGSGGYSGTVDCRSERGGLFHHRNGQSCGILHRGLLGGKDPCCDVGTCNWTRSFCGANRNLVAGVGALVFFRDLEDDYGLSRNAASAYMFSTDAQSSAMGGIEFFLQNRGCCGRGWEARYWGLYPSDRSSQISSMPYTAIAQLSQITHGPTGYTAQQIFDRTQTHIFTRSNQFHNVELNRLINAGQICGWLGRPGNYELLHGLRWFEFDETINYCAHSLVNMPMRLDYNVKADNTLLGYQFGGRMTQCLSNRLQLTSGLTFGLYNNRIRHRQTISDENYLLAYINQGPNAGRSMDYWSGKNDLATLSELQAGLAYSISCSTRITLGYRVLGITGLALAPNQIPYSFADTNEIRRIHSNGSMILHGLYGGLNVCF